ncbi:cytochrome P450 [Amycolatopsis sulphurea]|uniref:Cytochrome P450 n=1 Tax=Amycolatopsis sulphurea TaxID=76022 RepID=A0A2A9F7K3_9PSEU|nr:cytochrome P450 [Amycolatopsis sulphurea]PFG46405.1 cytochrome P450 [Amycolatopsis sulphurea]
MTDQPGMPDMPMHMRRCGVDPVPELHACRARAELSTVDTEFGQPAFLVTRYEDVRAVLGDSTRFSNAADFSRRRGAEPASPEQLARARAGNILVQDPPEHTRLRRLLAREFTQARMRDLRPRIEQIVDARLDALAAAGRPADLVTEFAMPIPLLVICELFAVPEADRAEFQARSGRLFDVSLETGSRLAAARENREYMASLAAAALAAPGDDILGRLVRDHPDELTRDELTGIATLVLVAGHETTASMLALGTQALLWHPGQLALVRDDPAAVRPAVEELLRWLSVVHSATLRLTTAEIRLQNTTVPEGSLVLCSLPAANRDPAYTPDPDRLDIRRGRATHVAFGHGLHHCLGAPLARTQLETALPRLFRRFPGLAPVAAEPEYSPYAVVYGARKLPVTW